MKTGTIILALGLLGAIVAHQVSKADDNEPVSGCRAVDGDGIACGDERIRILGIDAPEMGPCKPGRHCAPGNGPESTASLSRLIAGRALTINRRGVDKYDRTLAHVTVDYGDGTSANLACYQLANGHAIYKPRWDNLPQGEVKRECGL